jgi:two-component system, NtrC family, nitrogen regulation sensor histidine kinase NtrY
VVVEVDDTMMAQAFTNLVKNAGEAIQTRREAGVPRRLRARNPRGIRRHGTDLLITIADNGIGLPEDRARLFEPYVTTRAEGTGWACPSCARSSRNMAAPCA